MFTQLLALQAPSWFIWLAELLLKSAALLVLAMVVTLLCRRASAAQRHLIWTLAVIGVLLLPLFTASLPAWQVVRLPERAPVIAHEPIIPTPQPTPVLRDYPAPTTPTLPGPVTLVAPLPATTPIVSTPAEVMPLAYSYNLPWYLWVTLAWAAGSLLLLVRWIAGIIIMRRIVRAADPAPEQLQSALREVAAQLNLRRQARILLGDHIAVPMVTGALHPAVLLPALATDWPADRLRAVLLHELGHVQRRDILTQALARLAVALYWPNPLVWLAAHRLRVERETACDDLVLAANIKASDYAAHLLEITRALPTRLPISGIAMARTSKLGQRIQGVLQMKRNRNTVSRWVFGIALLIAVPICITLAVAQQSTVDKNFAQPAFQSSPFPKTAGPVVVSPDGNHVAFVDTINGKRMVVIDGKPGKQYEKIRAPWFEREPAKGDDRLNYTGLFFSPDGNRLAYAVIQYTGPNGEDRFAGRQVMVIDGVEGDTYTEVSIPIFSADSKHVSYAANTGAGWVVVLDGKELGPYDEIGGTPHFSPEVRSVVFSPIGNRLAYTVRQGKQWHVVVDGKVGPAYQDVSYLTFSSDGRHIAYVAERNNRQFIIYDGGEKPAYDEVGYPTFSPDGRQFAYVTRRGKASMVVAGGYEGRAYADITSPPIFSPNGASLAYHAIQEQGGKRTAVAVLNGNEVTWGQNLTMIDGMQFSPDSHRLAFTAHTPHGYTRLFIRGEGVYRTIQYAYAPVFSPDGLRVAYLIQQGRKVGMGVDATTLPTSLDDIPLYITFSPDSRHLVAVMGTAGTTEVTVTVDGKSIGRYERLIGAEGERESGRSDVVFFAAPDRFHFYAVKDGAIQRIDATVPSPADASPLSITLAPQPGNATVSAYEPVVMTYRTVNISSKAIELPAWATEYTLRLEVYNAHGQLLAATPVRDVPMDFLHTVEQLKPGEGVEQTLLISAFFTFAEPGRYTVRAKQFAPFYPLNDPMHFQGTAEAEVTVLPFDDQRLQARITEHWNAMRQHHEIGANSKILYSIRHNLALPALEWMVREWDDDYAARAIIRIGTPEARQLLKRLQAEPGRVGKAARDAEKLPIDIDMWDIDGDTPKKIPRPE